MHNYTISTRRPAFWWWKQNFDCSCWWWL